jgi:hypothetical protein
MILDKALSLKPVAISVQSAVGPVRGVVWEVAVDTWVLNSVRLLVQYSVADMFSSVDLPVEKSVENYDFR